MTNAELIATLRCCGKKGGCLDCPLLWKPSDACFQLAADDADLIKAQQKSLDECARQLADMAAQLPKEGEWIDDNGAKVPLDRDGYTTGMCRCSVCNDWLIASDEYEVRGRYCPNCGSRMAKGEQE